MTYTTKWFNGRKEKFAEVIKNPRNILEIGCWEGQATVWFAENYPEATVETIDTFGGNPEHKKKDFDLPNLEERYRENIGGLNNIITHQGTSKEVLPTLGDFDFIYVDGSHAAYDVIFDAVVAWEHLRSGGILAFDDYEWCKELPETERPRMAIDAFLNIYKGKYELLYKKSYVIIRKTMVHVQGD